MLFVTSKVQHGAAYYQIELPGWKRNFDQIRRQKIMPGKFGGQAGGKLPHMLNTCRVRINCKYFEVVSEKVDKITAIATTCIKQ